MRIHMVVLLAAVSIPMKATAGCGGGGGTASSEVGMRDWARNTFTLGNALSITTSTGNVARSYVGQGVTSLFGIAYTISDFVTRDENVDPVISAGRTFQHARDTREKPNAELSDDRNTAGSYSLHDTIEFADNLP